MFFARTTTAVVCALSGVVLFSSPAVAATPPVSDTVLSPYIETHRPLSTFGYQEKALRGGKKTLRRALQAVGNAHQVCPNGTCENLCLHLAAKLAGYGSSGSATALSHWKRLARQGYTNQARTPPVGASVYWDVGTAGHVATYVGDGMVVSNWDGKKGDNVYLLPIDIFENQWASARYLGWAPPVFYGVPL